MPSPAGTIGRLSRSLALIKGRHSPKELSGYDADSKTKISRLDMPVAQQLFASPFQCHMPRLQYVPSIGDLERVQDILLHKQDRRPAGV